MVLPCSRADTVLPSVETPVSVRFEKRVSPMKFMTKTACDVELPGLCSRRLRGYDLHHHGKPTHPVTTIADPVPEARRLVDHWLLSADPDDMPARLAGAAEALVEARKAGDDSLIAEAWRLHLMTMLEAERVTDIYVSLGELDEWCETQPNPHGHRVRDWIHGLRAVLDGDPDLAEELLATAVSPREALGPLTTIRWFQGRLHELEARYLQLRRDEPTESLPVLLLAWIWAEQDRMTAARGVLDTLGDIGDLPRDRDWLLRMSVLAEISVLLEDRALAETVYRLLSPYPRRLVLIGNGFGCWGTTDRPLGVLSHFLGRPEEAIEHFTAKLELSAAAGAHPWLVRGQFDLAELLLDVDDFRRSEALRYAREGIAAARRLGYPMLRERADAVEQRLRQMDGTFAESAPAAEPTPAAHPAMVPAAATDGLIAVPVISVLGGLVVRAADGTVPVWSSRKARELLGMMVAARGRPVSRERLMEYLWPGQAPSRLRNRLSVAVSAVRRALDPAADHARDRFVSTTRDTVRLRLDQLKVDAEEFLHAGRAALTVVPSPRDLGSSASGSSAPGDIARAEAKLSAAALRYAGEAFADEPFTDWAASLRDECAIMQVALLHAIIDISESSARRADCARQILAIDPYDDIANHALAEALEALGARGLAEATRARFQQDL